MISRSAFTQLRYSATLLVVALVGLLVAYVAPVALLAVGAVAGNLVVAAAGALAWALMTASFYPTIRYYRLRWPWALGLPVSAILYAAMTVDSARTYWRGSGVTWKGRRYHRPEPRAPGELGGRSAGPAGP
jgi:hypothetical protein